MLEQLKCDYKLNVLRGNNLYYSGGMRLGMQYIKDNSLTADYFLMINDDVDFFDKSIEEIIKQSFDIERAIIVGACCNKFSEQTYSAVYFPNKFKVAYRKILIGSNKEADTFCANCVLIPWIAFSNTPIIDSAYTHSLGDFDYGLSLCKMGWKIFSSKKFVGICEYNSHNNTWLDKKIEFSKRLKMKESPKGLPFREWFYFLNKNFGFFKAIIFSLTPYLKIFLRR